MSEKISTPAGLKAQKRVQQLKEFYAHAFWYVAVNVSLVIFNAITSPEFYWVIFPIAGWGIGLFFHGVSVFLGNSLWSEWEARKTKELTEKYEKENAK